MTSDRKRLTSVQYEKEMREIKEGLLHMSGLAEKSLEADIRALVERDSELAQRVISEDERIDQLDMEIEEKCIRLLALRQPLARDLRFITTAIKINGHLERIGDMAVNIAEKVIILNDQPRLTPYNDLPRMAEIARGMIRESLAALLHENVELAVKVCRDDEMVNNLNEQLFRKLFTFMIEDPRNIHRAVIISQISKNLERISDHAKGIATMVIYTITGNSARHKVDLGFPEA